MASVRRLTCLANQLGALPNTRHTGNADNSDCPPVLVLGGMVLDIMASSPLELSPGTSVPGQVRCETGERGIFVLFFKPLKWQSVHESGARVANWPSDAE